MALASVQVAGWCEGRNDCICLLTFSFNGYKGGPQPGVGGESNTKLRQKQPQWDLNLH